MEVRERRRVFETPKRPKQALVRIPPPVVHMLPYITGGLGTLYKQLKNGSIPKLHDHGIYTDTKGIFRPQMGMPSLACRYHYIEVIGHGQSSILIKAKDTFCGDELVAIKVLHENYRELGAQEFDCLRRLNEADPFDASCTLRIKNTFLFDSHYCMVFELLYPMSLHRYFKQVNQSQVLEKIRKVTVRLLQALGFLQQRNVIHADLKPENILLTTEGNFSTAKIVDFGNAIHCIYEEMSLYYDDFELQTLLYRAPEVMYGVKFGREIDLWSLGCILAELYLRQPLFYGKNRVDILHRMVSVLGPLPAEVFQQGKFYKSLKAYCANTSQQDGMASLRSVLTCNDYPFMHFLTRLLQYDPGKRMTIAEAAQHPFMASELGLKYLVPFNNNTECATYPTVMLTSDTYTNKPYMSNVLSRQHLSSAQLLTMGTYDKPGNQGKHETSTSSAYQQSNTSDTFHSLPPPTVKVVVQGKNDTAEDFRINMQAKSGSLGNPDAKSENSHTSNNLPQGRHLVDDYGCLDLTVHKPKGQGKMSSAASLPNAWDNSPIDLTADGDGKAINFSNMQDKHSGIGQHQDYCSMQSTFQGKLSTSVIADKDFHEKPCSTGIPQKLPSRSNCRDSGDSHSGLLGNSDGSSSSSDFVSHAFTDKAFSGSIEIKQFKRETSPLTVGNSPSQTDKVQHVTQIKSRSHWSPDSTNIDDSLKVEKHKFLDKNANIKLESPSLSAVKEKLKLLRKNADLMKENVLKQEESHKDPYEFESDEGRPVTSLTTNIPQSYAKCDNTQGHSSIMQNNNGHENNVKHNNAQKSDAAQSEKIDDVKASKNTGTRRGQKQTSSSRTLRDLRKDSCSYKVKGNSAQVSTSSKGRQTAKSRKSLHVEESSSDYTQDEISPILEKQNSKKGSKSCNHVGMMVVVCTGHNTPNSRKRVCLQVDSDPESETCSGIKSRIKKRETDIAADSTTHMNNLGRETTRNEQSSLSDTPADEFASLDGNSLSALKHNLTEETGMELHSDNDEDLYEDSEVLLL